MGSPPCRNVSLGRIPLLPRCGMIIQIERECADSIEMRLKATLLTSLVGLAAAAPAHAATRIGQTHAPTECSDAGYTVLKTGVSSGDASSSPAAGVITSWSVMGNYDSTAVVVLRLYRPAQGGWQLTAESAAEPL